jgi:hypothetical protein
MNAEQQEAELNGAMNVDRQGDARQLFPYKGVYCWKLRGFFDKDLKVWRMGETAERAILLKAVFRSKFWSAKIHCSISFVFDNNCPTID